MDRQDLMNIASRIVQAPSYEARIGELFRLAPEETLNRYGLSHRASWVGGFLAFTGAFALGATIGAGTALLLAPSSGTELRGKLRQRAQRLEENVKDVAERTEGRVGKVRERVMNRYESSGGDTGAEGSQSTSSSASRPGY
jgi:gas vesicle protein